MIEKIKEWFFYKDFKVKQRAQNNAKIEINPEQSITILFDGTNEDDRKTVHRFKKKLNPDGKKNIKSLAYINNALPLDNVDYAAYNHKNLKWYGVPFGQKVEEFIIEQSDLLIILCKEMKPYFEYIIAHSPSKFKVGADINKAEKYFDLIIECENKSDIDNICQSIIKGIEKISVK